MKIYNIKRKMVFMDKVKNVDALYSIGILWNMGTKYADEIISEISQSVKLLKVRKYDLKEIYDTFVIDCYKGDDEAFLDGYIYDKIKNMKNAGNNKIFLFIVQINNPTYKLNTENGIIQCVEIRNIKHKIREQYAKKIDGYFFDNLIHMTDNDEEYQRVSNVIENYNNYIES